MQSTSATSSTARLIVDERRPGARASSSQSPSRPRSDPARLLAPADPDVHPEPVAAVGEQRDQLGVLAGPAAGGRRRSGAAPGCSPGCDSSGGTPGRAPRRAGRGRRTAPRSARRTRLPTAARRSRAGCRRPTRRGRRGAPRRPRDRRGSAQPPAARLDLASGGDGRSRLSSSPMSARSASTWSVGASTGRADRSCGPASGPAVRAEAASRRRCAGASGVGSTPRAPCVGRAASEPAEEPAGPRGRRLRTVVSGAEACSPATSRRSWPARSSPTRISPSSRSGEAGSPRAFRRLDRHLDHGLATSARRERPPVEPLRRAEEAACRARCRDRRHRPAAASSATFARVRAPGGRTAPGGTSSIRPPRLRRRRPRGARPTSRKPGADTTERGRDQGLGRRRRRARRPRRRGRCDGSTAASSRRERGGLPAPRRADRRTGQRLQREDRRRLARRASRPSPSTPSTAAPGSGGPAAGRGPAGSGGAARAAGLASQPRPSDASSPSARVSRRAADPERRPSPSRRSRAPEVGPEPRLDRAARAALEPLDEAADQAGSRPRTRATGCARATGRRRAGRTRPPWIRSEPTRPGIAVEAARRQEGMEEAEPQRRLDRGRAQVALDSARGSPRARRAGAACGGRAARRRATSPPSTTGKRSRRRRARRRRQSSGTVWARSTSASSSGAAR